MLTDPDSFGRKGPSRDPREQLVAVVVVVLRGAEALALRRSSERDAAPGLWETISGRVELGEAPERAALREVEEETGLDVTLDPRPIDAYAMERAGRPMTVIAYRAWLRGGEVRRSDEHDDHRWATLEGLVALAMPPRLVAVVRRAMSAPTVSEPVS